MDTSTDFRKYAADCETMSNLANDAESKAVWKGMAERWLLCAKLAEDEDDALRRQREEKAKREPRRRPLEKRMAALLTGT
jgi:hypothetical protein